MKINVSAKNLKKAVDSIKPCIATKPLMPVLAGIKIECVEPDNLVLTAYNLAEGLQVTCEAECNAIGSFVILEKDLSSLLDKLKGDLEIVIDDNKATFSTDKSNVEFQILDATEYPDLIFKIDEPIGSRLLANSFGRAVDACSVSVSKDETKPLLQGINIKADSATKTATLASTDGHRLTVCKFYCEWDIEPVTLPAKFLSKLPDTIAEEIRMSIGINEALFVTDDSVSATCRVYEGKYPDYELLLPKSASRTLTVDRLEMLELLSIAEVAIANNMVQLSLEPNTLTISSGRDAAEAISTMECQLIGSPLNIGLNLKYFQQGLKMFDDEKATLNINGALEPVTIVSSDGFLLYLMMPIQIRN